MQSSANCRFHGRSCGRGGNTDVISTDERCTSLAKTTASGSSSQPDSRYTASHHPRIYKHYISGSIMLKKLPKAQVKGILALLRKKQDTGLAICHSLTNFASSFFFSSPNARDAVPIISLHDSYYYNAVLSVNIHLLRASPSLIFWRPYFSRRMLWIAMNPVVSMGEKPSRLSMEASCAE